MNGLNTRFTASFWILEDQSMGKVLFVATVVKTHIMEFHIPYLKMLKEEGWQTAVAARNDYENPEDCVIPYCDVYYDIPFERNPFKPGNVKAYRRLKKIIDEGEFDIIHCHTPVGGMIGRLAAESARKHGTRVFYTAHGFHFYKGAPLMNWLVYYPAERFLSYKTDELITINKEDYKRAKSFHAKETVYMPGIGIDINRFSRNTVAGSDKRKEFGIRDEETFILSVGEVNKNKNHRVVIEVLPEFKNCKYIICGRGPLKEEYEQLAEELGVSDRVILAGYRNDVADFYKSADVFVFPSYREGLPVAVMEAMATGLPIVAARNRGTNDLLEGSRLLFDPADREELKSALKKAINEDCTDEITRNQEILKNYSLNNTLQLMKKFYFGDH